MPNIRGRKCKPKVTIFMSLQNTRKGTLEKRSKIVCNPKLKNYLISKVTTEIKY